VKRLFALLAPLWARLRHRLGLAQWPVPTGRTVLALLVLAGLGLAGAVVAPGAWFAAPLLGVGLLALVLVDARLAGG
jgi:hypothetical protein